MLVLYRALDSLEFNKFNSILEAVSLDKYLPGAVICTVGAGGKTTTTKRLAGEIYEQLACDKLKVCLENNTAYDLDGTKAKPDILSKHVLVTTTTHMACEPEIGFMMPDDVENSGFSYQNAWIDELPWNDYPFLILGCSAHKEGHPFKMQGLPEELRVNLEQRFYATVIEADGARRLPFKTPGEFEPVLPQETDIVFVVMGLSAIGHPIDEVSFRPEMIAEILGTDAHDILTEDYAAKILIDGFEKKITGLVPGVRIIYVINQADTAELVSQAKIIADRLPGCEVLITSHRVDSFHDF